jgi:transposase
MVAKEIRYLSPRKIRERMDVSAGTVRRWAKQYGWERKNINARVIRYLATDVEQSLGVSFE